MRAIAYSQQATSSSGPKVAEGSAAPSSGKKKARKAK